VQDTATVFFEKRPDPPITPLVVDLTPVEEWHPAGSLHTVKAHVTTEDGEPFAESHVDIYVQSGPDAWAWNLQHGEGPKTDSNGDITWTYGNNGQQGNDLIVAWAHIYNEYGQITHSGYDLANAMFLTPLEVTGFGPASMRTSQFVKPYIEYDEPAERVDYKLYRKKADGTWAQVATTKTYAEDTNTVRITASNYPLRANTVYKVWTRAVDNVPNVTRKTWQFKTGA